jgi:hypothetical protein
MTPGAPTPLARAGPRVVFIGGPPDARARVTDVPVIAKPFGITEVQRVVREVAGAGEGPETGG